MKFPALPFRAVFLLALGAALLLRAEPPAPEAAPPALPKPPLEVTLIGQFDKDGDHRLDTAERSAARAWLAQHPIEATPAPTRPGQQPPPPPAALEPVKPGEKLGPPDAPAFAGQPLYAPGTLRTLFLDFADADWEKELGEFAHTDVLVPANLTVDGTTLAGVGARFLSRASSSGEGYQCSLKLALDYTQAGQNLAGVRELTLVAADNDPTFLRTMLYYRIAREYVPTPAANFVRLVINGEDWGVYTSVQPFDESFVRENFHTSDGARFVATGGNLNYLGEDPAAYRDAYRLLSPDDPAAWAALIRLCRVLNQTPSAKLEDALEPLLDISGTFKFLALQNVLINQAGYGSSNASYGLYLDPEGRFHLIPQAAGASFRLVEVREYSHGQPGGGGRGGRRGGGERESRGNSDGAGGRQDAAGAKVADDLVKKRKEFPRQNGSDLAMLLSYSFVNKADADFDRQLTKDEWLGFARSWFIVMDEDSIGQLTRDQFIAKVRLFVTPPSVLDGRTTQTFGKVDAAGDIGQDLFTAIDANHDGQLTPEEFQAAFAGWFTAWSDPKSGRLTEDGLHRGLDTVLTKTVFQADQSFIATKPTVAEAEAEGRGGEGRGGRRGGQGEEGVSGGVGLNLGPILNLGLGNGRGGRSGGGGSVVTFGEQLDPLAGLGDDTKPLIAKILAESSLRARYLTHVHDMADDWLVWSRLGPIAQEYDALIAAEVKKSTHKPASYEHFVRDLDQDPADSDDAPSLKAFVTARHRYLQEDNLGEQ